MQMIAYREQPEALKRARFDFEPEPPRPADTWVGVLCAALALALFAGWIK